MSESERRAASSVQHRGGGRLDPSAPPFRQGANEHITTGDCLDASFVGVPTRACSASCVGRTSADPRRPFPV
eukprot:2254896-Alexandrium_andersonii.AAC.1